MQRGGNCFDTAYAYRGGRMERLLGRWVSDRGIRDHLDVSLSPEQVSWLESGELDLALST